MCRLATGLARRLGGTYIEDGNLRVSVESLKCTLSRFSEQLVKNESKV